MSEIDLEGASAVAAPGRKGGGGGGSQTALTASRVRRHAARCLTAAVLVAVTNLGAGCATAPGAPPPLEVGATQRVAPGQSRDQVRSALGAPATTTTFATLGEEVWAYKMVDPSQAKPRRNFYVYFDDRTGAVRRTETLSDGDYDTGCGTGR